MSRRLAALSLILLFPVAARALEALDAKGPDPDHREKLMLFGQFVGSWDIDWTGTDSQGVAHALKAEWHFGWILNGRAIQDVWIVPPRPQPANEEGEYGTTVRMYDPKADDWKVVWTGPRHEQMQTFVARRSGSEIVMEGASPSGARIRWIFSEITATSFHWRAVASKDGGKTWQPPQEEMRARRTK